jgi:hypothetical protein
MLANRCVFFHVCKINYYFPPEKNINSLSIIIAKHCKDKPQRRKKVKPIIAINYFVVGVVFGGSNE